RPGTGEAVHRVDDRAVTRSRFQPEASRQGEPLEQRVDRPRGRSVEVSGATLAAACGTGHDPPFGYAVSPAAKPACFAGLSVASGIPARSRPSLRHAAVGALVDLLGALAVHDPAQRVARPRLLDRLRLVGERLLTQLRDRTILVLAAEGREHLGFLVVRLLALGRRLLERGGALRSFALLGGGLREIVLG